MRNDDFSLSLARDFPSVNDGQWRALVDRVLAGADFDKKLVARSYDGIAIKPLYTRADFAGQTPLSRRAVAARPADGWDIRQAHGLADPAAVNDAILEDLAGGVTSIALKIDASGKHGTVIRDQADLDRALAGVHLDFAPVVLDTEGATVPPAALLSALVDKRKAAQEFTGNFGLDELGAAAVAGATTPIDLGPMAEMAVKIAGTYTKARACNVRGTIYHAAGASEAQELGCAVATAVAYLRALADRLSIDRACRQIAFTLTADADFFLTVAKFRAIRRLWIRVAEVCGVSDAPAPITACTATRMMTRRDPWVNVLRTTTACFAAGIAGADAVTVLPYDSALGETSARGRRIARNTQIVLIEEASLAKVTDPAGGAWLIEDLTEELARKAWAFFQEVEREGGMAQALAKGFIAEKIAKVRIERARNIATRKDPITGVSEFPNLGEPVSKSVREERPAPSAIALQPIRLAEGFEHLRDISDAALAQKGKRPLVFLATIGASPDYAARATFAKNLFEAGGIEARDGASGADPAAVAKAFIASDTHIACLCSSDALYSDHAAPIAKALKDAGARLIYLAGRPGGHEAAWRTAGIDGFVYMGCDVLAVLEHASRIARQP